MGTVRKMARLAAGSVMVVALAAPAALAGPLVAPHARARQVHQAGRIHQGVMTGQLTPAETKVLKAEERAVQQEKRSMKADGSLTSAERDKIHQDLDGLSHQIYEETHDAEKVAK